MPKRLIPKSTDRQHANKTWITRKDLNDSLQMHYGVFFHPPFIWLHACDVSIPQNFLFFVVYLMLSILFELWRNIFICQYILVHSLHAYGYKIKWIPTCYFSPKQQHLRINLWIIHRKRLEISSYQLHIKDDHLKGVNKSSEFVALSWCILAVYAWNSHNVGQFLDKYHAAY